MRQTFDRIREERGWNTPRMQRILDNLCGRLSRRLPQGTPLELTVFQKKVIEHPKFWRDWSEDAPIRNLMVQGATSAGKTLVSELAVLDTLNHNKKAIVLVPLKAMVRERTRHFREDMGHGQDDFDISVFGSSSDYMENDEQIINGGYDVAIIVYEKFFAMLSQGNTRIMENCDLLIVDELSMLSLEQRGPKLEMALEIVRSRFPQTRIMCLATCDCSTEKICGWLDIDEPIITTARPVALEEHILRLNGRGTYRTIPANHECLHEANAPEAFEEEIKVFGYNNNQRLDDKVKNLLLAVMKKLYIDTPDARLLVFASSQARAERIAEFLKENLHAWCPKDTVEPDDEFYAALQSCDYDEGQTRLINTLLPSGIAYHHAGLSSTLRELIEEQFQKTQSGLRVIVATETLTVGVNMPFDAMIMTSHLVPRGHGELMPLTPQEYRNYIGRAGRLGQSNRTGKTYLFADDAGTFERYWKSYFQREEVKTALSKAKERTLAPYYLSLINNKVGTEDQGYVRKGTEYTLKQLETLFDQSLAKACGANSFNTRDLQKGLSFAHLSGEVKGGSFFDYDEEPTEKYAISGFGTHMAPYAFSIGTCKRIYYYFYEGYDHGGLKLGLTREEITSDRYLLDILYHICCHPEIANSSNVNYPQGDSHTDRTFKAKQRVLDQLRTILNETDENGKKRYALWCDDYSGDEYKGNDLWRLINENNLDDEGDKLQAALRAIVLFYWTKGYPIEELRKKTNFHQFTKLIAGDIERLAEAAGFHLDAIHKCLSTAFDPKSGRTVLANPSAVHAFYELQIRVKYGMPRELTVFANKHVHGLDRKRLLLFKEKADEAKLTPMQYLFFTPFGHIPEKVLTEQQHEQLRDAMLLRGNVRHIDTLMEIIRNDAGSKITEEELDCLQEIASWGDPEQSEMNPATIYRNLKDVISNEAFRDVSIFTDGDAACVVWVLQDALGHRQEIRFGILSADKTDENLQKFLKKDPGGKGAYANILVVPHKFTSEQMARAMKAHGVLTLVDNTYLTFLLANAIRLSVDNGYALTELLADLRGAFTTADFRYFPLMNFLHRETEPQEPPRFRILTAGGEAHFNATEMAPKHLGDYDILPWGDDLTSDRYNFAACPTVICVNRRDITRSESLTRFIYAMQQQKFRHCLLLLDSPEAEEIWNNPEPMESYGNTEWSPLFNAIHKAVVSNEHDAQKKIEDFVTAWHPSNYLVGISYAHYSSQPSEEISGCKSDCDLILELARALAEEFGEDRIFFDQFSPAKEVFRENRNAEKSIKAYETCAANIVLWNFWTKNNENCQRECQAILKRSENDKAYCLFVKTGHPKDPVMPSSAYYSMHLTKNSIPDIVNTIKDKVKQYTQ